MEDIVEIKKIIKTGNLVYGREQSVKKLKEGKIEKVYMASNSPEELKQELKHYADISGVKLVELSVANTELGTICKKQFAVSVIGLLKTG